MRDTAQHGLAFDLWTDGSCLAVGCGPGGWAFVLLALRDGREEKRLERSGFVPETTNNRMEMLAVVEGLRALTRPVPVTVYSDAAYVVRAYQLGWVERWKSLGWRRKPTSAKGELLNVDLWRALDAEVERHRVTFVQVKGHSGVPANERCDRLAGAAARRATAFGRDPGGIYDVELSK